MKKILLLLTVGVCFCLPVAGQEIDKMPSVTVTGTAEVQVTPDEVVFSLDVTKTDLNLQTAKHLNDETVSKILELAKRFNIEPKNVKTDYISVEMKYESVREAKKKIYDEDGDEIGKKNFKGYEVSKTVIVRLTDITRFEDFFSEALKTGVSEIGSVKFETSKLRENKDKAREMAMKAAREKATALAGAIGQTIGKAVKISEISSGNQNYSISANNSANFTSTGGTFSEGVATFAPGAIKIEAQVTVVFLLT